MAKQRKVEVAERLSLSPDRARWEAFRKYLLKSKAKYYKVFYPKKLKGKSDMLAAYVIIYDSKYVPMFRVPVIMKTSKGTAGATIYLRGAA